MDESGIAAISNSGQNDHTALYCLQMTSIPFISLDDTSTVPIYRQIYDAIRRAILTGEFASGLQLPASRLLAEQLGVSRMTVMSAYDSSLPRAILKEKSVQEPTLPLICRKISCSSQGKRRVKLDPERSRESSGFQVTEST